MEGIRLSKKEPVITEEDFLLFSDLVKEKFGINIKKDRILTFHTKIVHRLCILGFSSYREYYDYIISDSSGKEIFSLIAHLANNETYFMRENVQLEVFINILKDIKYRKLKNNEKKIRILSAGCSTGEEVYTINIALIDSGLFPWGWDLKIIGIDLSDIALKKAKNAIYTRNSFRISNGNGDFIKRCFNRRDDKYIIKDLYRRNIEFIQGNILDESLFKDIKDLDIIFCKNVMIYMTDDAIQRVAKNFYHSLVDEGYLFIGTSESLLQKTELFVPELREGVIVYRKNLLAE